MPLEEKILTINDVTISYSDSPAVKNVSFDIAKNKITSIIGPSGCGKSTLLRSLNRMNDFIPEVSIEGRVDFDGQDLYGKEVDPVEVRHHIGMVFQKTNPFP
ncbi:MAG: ATP-binding cassette domain-containing protein, partial [Pseudohongiella sp.]|nr:ATP-binding cassette domain-containing protein [Pseudohongiella sp.]